MTRWVSVLLVATIIAFVAQGAMPGLENAFCWFPAAALVRPWTAVTYLFLHGGFGHLLFNMIGLASFGPPVEARIGGGRFLALYFFSGIVAALFCFISPMTPVIGASGAILGVAFAYARYWPDSTVLIAFVIPMSARMMVIAYALFSIGGQVFNFEQGVSHLGHLGGLAGGWIFCLWIERYTGARNFRKRAEMGWTVERKAAAPVPKAIVELATGEKETLERWGRIRADQLHPVNREEFDRIRGKIATEGMRSLSALEREFMERFAALAG